MNPNDMLDYALGQLESPALAEAERKLATDPLAAESVRRLSLVVHRLLDDGEEYAPPPGLAGRTVSFVVETSRRRRTILDFVPVTVPFRGADVAVAAGILVAGLLTLLPAVQRSRERMEQAGCGYNLQQLGRALWQYGSRHQHYPFCPEENPRAPAGAFVALLHDGGQLGEDELHMLNCPCNNKTTRGQRSPLPDYETVCKLHATNPAKAPCRARLRLRLQRRLSAPRARPGRADRRGPLGGASSSGRPAPARELPDPPDRQQSQSWRSRAERALLRPPRRLAQHPPPQSQR